MKITVFLAFLLSLGCTSKQVKMEADSKRLPALSNDFKHIEVINLKPLDINFRAGYALETGELRGCILYLQGLADSVMNHDDFFQTLNRAGYRLIFFDYMGQGGSAGSMNNSRIQIELPINKTQTMDLSFNNQGRYYSIPEQGQYFWDHFKMVKNAMGQDCKKSRKIVMGWSTGGLAAYRLAHEKWADGVVLIAVDAFKANNPMAVPQFSTNLKLIASRSTLWKIDPQIKGLVFFGTEDNYVDFAPTENTLKENAPHFKFKRYDGARHELHNEIEAVTDDLKARTIEFLNAIVKEPRI